MFRMYSKFHNIVIKSSDFSLFFPLFFFPPFFLFLRFSFVFALYLFHTKCEGYKLLFVFLFPLNYLNNFLDEMPEYFNIKFKVRFRLRSQVNQLKALHYEGISKSVFTYAYMVNVNKFFAYAQKFALKFN